VENSDQPIVASRSESAILRDLTESPTDVMQAGKQYHLLTDILDTLSEINPMLRSIIRDQGHWDIDRLEERIRENLKAEDS
jgi:hypothetical protein